MTISASAGTTRSTVAVFVALCAGAVTVSSAGVDGAGGGVSKARDPRDQLDIVGRQDQPQLALLDLGQHEHAERQVVRVDFLLGREGDRARLGVRAFDKPDRRFQRHQPGNILDRAVEVGLERDAGAGVVEPQPAIQVQCRLGVGAPFHVDPQEALGLRSGSSQLLQVRVGGCCVDIET